MIYQQCWIHYSNEIRTKLRELFSIPKSSGCTVENERLTSDGVTNDDLKVLTDEKMAEYLKQPITHSEDMLEKIVKQLETPEATTIVEEPLKTNPSATSNELEDSNKCDKCEFVGKNIKSLRLHKIKKHQ